MRVHGSQLLCWYHTCFPCRRSRAKPEQSCCSFQRIPGISGFLVTNVFVKARKTLKNEPEHRIVAKHLSCATTGSPKSGVRSWLRSLKRKSLVVSIRKPMSESFELIPKREHLSTRSQS